MSSLVLGVGTPQGDSGAVSLSPGCAQPTVVQALDRRVMTGVLDGIKEK